MGVVVAIGAFVGQDSHQLALLDGDGAGVGVDDVGRCGEERWVLADGVLAGFVKVGDKLVQLAFGVVAREPERFTIVRIVGTTTSIVVLFLALVKDWRSL